jgi:hypothetical protein
MSAWSDFLDEVRAAELDLGSPTEVWYRGHSDHVWKLVPSLPRESDWEKKEKALFLEFTKSASRLFDRRSSDWETLFDMQHYWVPTRLLDWTTVMGVAIAFILHGDYGDANDSALFVLDPSALNRLSGRDDVINVPETDPSTTKQSTGKTGPYKSRSLSLFVQGSRVTGYARKKAFLP